MKNRLCFIGSVKQNGLDAISVNSTWTHAQVDKQVRTWFPHVFEYLKSKHGTLSRLPDWQLIIRSASRFIKVEVPEPNGSTLLEHKGREKAGIADSALWFGKVSIIVSCTSTQLNGTMAFSDAENDPQYRI